MGKKTKKIKNILFVLGLVSFAIFIAFFIRRDDLMSPAPDLDSRSLQHDRSNARNRQVQIISSLGQEMSATLVKSGHIDVCVRGFKGGMGKAGTSYRYKCVYRTNSLYGINGSFPDIIKRISLILAKYEWQEDSGGTAYILGEYSTRKNQIKNAVNSLPSLDFYKRKQYIEVTYADTDPAKEDRSFSTQSKIEDSSQIIGGQMAGYNIHEDESFVDYNFVIQYAREKEFQYIFMISSEEPYFIN